MGPEVQDKAREVPSWGKEKMWRERKDDEEKGIIIQFQGDHRNEISAILKEKYNIEDIIIHGA